MTEKNIQRPVQLLNIRNYTDVKSMNHNISISYCNYEKNNP